MIWRLQEKKYRRDFWHSFIKHVQNVTAQILPACFVCTLHCVRLPYGQVQQVLGSRCLQVLDGADSIETLLKEELSRFHRTRTRTRVHRVETVHLLPAGQLKDRKWQEGPWASPASVWWHRSAGAVCCRVDRVFQVWRTIFSETWLRKKNQASRLWSGC